MRSPSHLSAKADLLRRLRTKLPKNSLHLPEAIYRPDLLPNPSTLSAPPSAEEELGSVREGLSQLPVPVGNGSQVTVLDGSGGDLYSETKSHEEPSEFDAELAEYLPLALVPVLYTEGFPSMIDGRSFWARLDFEPPDAFHAFEEYLSLKSEGARQLDLLRDTYDPLFLLECFYLYYWDYRSKAYDMFRVAAFRKLKEERALETENDHYLNSKDIFDRTMEFIKADDFWEQITPKVAIDLLRLVTQLQRVSAGVPAMSPPDSLNKGANGYLPPGAQLEVVLRHLSSGGEIAALDSNGLNGHAGESTRSGEALEEALKDPKTAFLAQELIIRMTGGTASDLSQFDLASLDG